MEVEDVAVEVKDAELNKCCVPSRLEIRINAVNASCCTKP